MSGIYGLFRKDGSPVGKETLDAMATAIGEWGPDGHGQWHHENFGTGFLLMRNTPESFHEALPIEFEDSCGSVLTADARIDNRAELCALFQIPVSKRTVLTDSHLLTLAYGKWGVDCPKHVTGAYAFAVWNPQAQNLFLARDHMGFRPLYFFEDRNKLVFASDVRAILAIDGVPRLLNQEAVVAARTGRGAYLIERSLYQDIRKVAPAHTVQVSRDRSQKQRYWSPEDAPAIRYRSDQEYGAAMLDLVNQAVACRLRSAFPIGSHLSGGLDSGAITILANRQLAEQSKQLEGIFTWSPAPRVEEYPLADERERIEKICQAEGLQCSYVDLTVENILQLWQEDMSVKPLATVYCESAVRKEAMSRGIRVLLSGWGGDEFATFHGTGFYSEKALKFQWRTLLAELRDRNARETGAMRSVLLNQLMMPLLPRWLKHLYRRSQIPKELVGNHEVKRETRQSLVNMVVGYSPKPTVRDNLLLPIEQGSLSYRIDGWSARGVSERIEYRYPLLDRRLIEFCFGIPTEQFVHEGWTRYIFRNAMTGVLPDSICWGTELKVEQARVADMQPKIKEASRTFTDKYNRGQIQLDGPSSMWQDSILPI